GSNWSSSAPDGDRITPLWHPAQYVATVCAAAAAAAGPGFPCAARRGEKPRARTPVRIAATGTIRMGVTIPRQGRGKLHEGVCPMQSFCNLRVLFIAARNRMSLRKTVLIQLPQHPPPTNELCQSTAYG